MKVQIGQARLSTIPDNIDRGLGVDRVVVRLDQIDCVGFGRLLIECLPVRLDWFDADKSRPDAGWVITVTILIQGIRSRGKIHRLLEDRTK